MIPIRSEPSEGGIPFVTWFFIICCTLVFFTRPASFQTGGLVPLDFIHSILHPSSDLPESMAAIVIAFFLHGSLIHLLSNMWYLWIFGTNIERRIGSYRFALAYLGCGIMSMLIQVASAPFSRVPIVGASGAIAGIMGLNLVLAPLSRILVWFPPIFVFRVPAFIFLILWFAIQYVNLWRGSAGESGGGIAWWAHAGGYVTGVAMAFAISRARHTRHK